MSPASFFAAYDSFGERRTGGMGDTDLSAFAPNLPT